MLSSLSAALWCLSVQKNVQAEVLQLALLTILPTLVPHAYVCKAKHTYINVNCLTSSSAALCVNHVPIMEATLANQTTVTGTAVAVGTAAFLSTATAAVAAVVSGSEELLVAYTMMPGPVGSTVAAAIAAITAICVPPYRHSAIPKQQWPHCVALQQQQPQ